MVRLFTITLSRKQGRFSASSACVLVAQWLFLVFAGSAPAAAHAESQAKALITGNGEAQLLQPVREHWLRSRMTFSGSSDQDSRYQKGALNVGVTNLFRADHQASFQYTDSCALRVNEKRQGLRVNYGLGLGRGRLDFALTNKDYDKQVEDGAKRVQKQGRVRNLTLAGSRPLFSAWGYRFRGYASYTSVSKRWRLQSEGLQWSDYQVSTFGVTARGHHRLPGGFSLATGVTTDAGVEYELAGASEAGGAVHDEHFRRFLVTASLDREFRDWQFGLDGQYQAASKDIPGSHRIHVASSRLSGGFNGQSLKAIEGGWLRLGTRSPSVNLPLASHLRAHFKLLLLKGWVPAKTFQHEDAGQLVSGELVLGFVAREFRADFSIGRMLDTTTTALNKPGRPDMRFAMHVPF